MGTSDPEPHLDRVCGRETLVTEEDERLRLPKGL